jgi:hypothetical protein
VNINEEDSAQEGVYDNNNNDTRSEYIPPHKAKLIQIPENGIQLPFNIISSTNNSKQSTETLNRSNNLILSTSQYKFPRKATTVNPANLSSSSSKSVNIPIETEFKSNFSKTENILLPSNSLSHNPTTNSNSVLNSQSKLPSSSSFLDSNNNNVLNNNSFSVQKKPSLFVLIIFLNAFLFYFYLRVILFVL